MTLLFRLLTAVARRMPRPLLDFLVGRVMLRAGFFRHPLRRRIILANYRRILAFAGEPAAPRTTAGQADAGPERLDGLLEETIPLYARLLIAMLARPEDLDFVREKVDVGPVLSGLEQARAAKRGAILAFSNFGNFAYAIIALLQRGVPLRIPVLRRETLRHLPHGWGSSFLTVGRSSRECLEALARNEVAVVITMVNYMTKRPSVEFFGAPARLGYAAARLAASSGAPILPAFTVFEEGRYRTQTDGLLRAQGGPDGVEATMAALARVQEKYIARYPAQWHVYDDFWNTEWMDSNYRMVRTMLRWF